MRSTGDLQPYRADAEPPGLVRHNGDPAATAAGAATLGEVGAELAVIYLPPPYNPTVLEPLADALTRPA